MIRSSITVAVWMSLGVTPPALAQQDGSASIEELYQDVQRRFADAYNHHDADAIAALFTENATRVTPNGIFQGRDAIRREIQLVLDMGLHDYSVRRTVSRREGDLVFDAGEWQAKLGNTQFHGYYSALLTRDGDQARIVEETVNVAAPGR